MHHLVRVVALVQMNATGDESDVYTIDDDGEDLAAMPGDRGREKPAELRDINDAGRLA
jgi:hypothetical protein